MASTSDGTTQPFRLLDPTEELRNNIYEFALKSPTPLIIPSSGKLHRPPLLQVNKQVRAETRILYPSLNEFRAIIRTNEHSGLADWIRTSTREERAAVRRLVLELQGYIGGFRLLGNTAVGGQEMYNRMHQLQLMAVNKADVLNAAGVSWFVLRAESATFVPIFKGQAAEAAVVQHLLDNGVTAVNAHLYLRVGQYVAAFL